jgi:prepilin-type N-terminal cleavage/methylation domain-containing protein
MRRKKDKTSPLKNIIRKHSGFTLIELLVAMFLLSILILIAFILYLNYLDKAKITVAEHTLVQTRDNLNLYNIDNGAYPASINFTDCVDENNHAVFSETFCNQLKADASMENYIFNPDNKKYVLTARAKDSKKTLITVTPDKYTR